MLPTLALLRQRWFVMNFVWLMTQITFHDCKFWVWRSGRVWRFVMAPHASPHGSCILLAWPCSPWDPQVRICVCLGAWGASLDPHWAPPAHGWATMWGYRCAVGSLHFGYGLYMPLATQIPLKSMLFKYPNSFRCPAIKPDSVLGQAIRLFWGL